MSRTFRRKNYEKAQSKQHFSSIDHRYTIFDYNSFIEYGVNGHGGYVLERKPTRQEYYKWYYEVHGESSHSKERSPDKSYRERHETEMREYNRRELRRYFDLCGEYDPLFQVYHRHSAKREFRDY